MSSTLWHVRARGYRYRTSGAMYSRVPFLSLSIVDDLQMVAMPKSDILTRRADVPHKRMFSSLRSRCTTRCWCM